MIAVRGLLWERLRSAVSTKHPKVHMGAELLFVPMCTKVSPNCNTRLRLDLNPAGGDPRDLEEFTAEAVRLASSFPERSSRQLAHELGISDQTPPA
jgi:hypothetical protein